MKRLIIFISLFFLFGGINQSFSDSGNTNTTWNNNNIECPSEIRHSVTHYGVPNSYQNNAPSSGTLNCITHTYYSSSNHLVGFTYGGGVTNCPPGERVVLWNGVNTITCQKFDDTPPAALDVTSNITNGGYFRATNSMPISITGNSAGGSPITVLQGQFENVTTPASFNSAKSSTTDNNPGTLNILETNENISYVDGIDITPNKYRPYSYNITNICDEAGNCTANPISFIYNVYAGYINSGLSITNGMSNFVSQIADAIPKKLTFTLKDDYNNNIVPVRRSDNTLVRDITFTTNYNNNLYLDQYTKSGLSGVEISGVNDSVYTDSIIGINNKATIINDVSSNGTYDLNFKIYSPTYNSSVSNGQQFVDGNFNINNITAKLSDNPLSDLLQGALDFQFRPQYTTNISGSIRDIGFIVGTQSGSRIDVIGGTPTNIYLEYGYFDGLFIEPHLSHPKLDLKYSKTFSTPTYVNVEEGHQSSIGGLSTIPNFGNSTSNIFTNLSQSGSLSTAEQNTYFATHIETIVGGKTTVYSSDIIGMSRYAGTAGGNNTSQRGIKITGITHSKNQVDIVDGQSDSDISLLGNLEKSYFQRDVRKNSYSLIKNITPNNGLLSVSNLSAPTNGVKLGDVLYFGGLDGDNVEINLSGNYSGVKTILVEGGNAYIRGNILANDKTKDILGIIALKNNTTGNGGNIYINPNVLEVDAVLYADRALISYDGSELSPANGGTYEYLNKQLYIYGTVFSNNTIGGSIQVPYICPFYVITCDLDTSQKYDMNYLRRGYETKISSTYEDYPVIINYNPLIQLTPPKLFEKTQ